MDVRALLLLLPVAGLSPQDVAPAGPERAVQFDQRHSTWSELLAAHVHPGGLVDYRGLGTRRAELDTYLAGLEAVSAKAISAWKPTEREAFWINAYNAYTVQLILDHYPVKSIKDLGGFFRPVWSRRFIPLEHLSPDHRRTLSLDEVEHEILAANSRTPLFHFAIVCASVSCPELRAEAYVSDELDGQLTSAGRRFLADKNKNSQEAHGGAVGISKIFDWSEKELATFPGGIRGILVKLGPESMQEDLQEQGLRITYLKYDWSLNEWTPPEEKR